MNGYMKILGCMAIATFLYGCGGGGGGSTGDNSKYHLTEPVTYYDSATTSEEMFNSMCGGPIMSFPDAIVGRNELQQYDTLIFALSDGSQNTAYHYYADNPNGKVFLYHQGHRGDPRTYGMNTIRGLLDAGYDVFAFQMPDVNKGHNHYNYVEHGLCVFVEPVIRVLNYLENMGISEAYMVGISGGGWTTTVVAAMDSRIAASYPVAGGIPLEYSDSEETGDFEQQAMHQVMSTLDMWKISNHVLAIQNMFDPCCSAGNVYESIAEEDAGPNWKGLVDYRNTEHSISEWSLQQILNDAAML